MDACYCSKSWLLCFYSSTSIFPRSIHHRRKKLPQALNTLQNRKDLGPWTRGQVNVLIAFMVAEHYGFYPGILAIIEGTKGPNYLWISEIFPEAVVVIFATCCSLYSSLVAVLPWVTICLNVFAYFVILAGVMILPELGLM